jgi:hypothetical protein
LIPGHKRIDRWSTFKWGYHLFECIVPSETFNLLFVYNVDEGGRMYPALARWKDGLPEGLYKRWLEATPVLTEDQSAFSLEVPIIADDGTVSYEDRRISADLLPVMKIPDVDPLQETLTIKWSPFGSSGCLLVSPEEDPNAAPDGVQGQQVANVTEAPAKWAAVRDASSLVVNGWISWRKPFDVLFPTGSGVDVLYHQGLLRRLIGQWGEGDRESALREAESWTATLSGDAEANTLRSWFLPKLAASEREALFAVEATFESMPILL